MSRHRITPLLRNFIAMAALCLALVPVSARAARELAPEMAVIQKLEGLLEQRTALETEVRNLKTQHDALLDRLLPLKREQERDYSWLRGASVRSLSGQAQELADQLSRLQSRIARTGEEMDLAASPLLDDLASQLMREADKATRLRGRARSSAEARIERIVQAIDMITARYDLPLRNDMAALVIPRILLEKETGEVSDLESLEQRLALLDDTLSRTRTYEGRIRQQADKARSYAMVKTTLDRERKRRSLFGDTGFSTGVLVRSVETGVSNTPPPDNDTTAPPGNAGDSGDTPSANGDSGPPGEDFAGGEGDSLSPDDPVVQGPGTDLGAPDGGAGLPGDIPTGADDDVPTNVPTGPEVVSMISAITLDPPRANGEAGAAAGLTTEALRSLFAESTDTPAESESLVFAPTTDVGELERQLKGLNSLKRDLAGQKVRLEQQIQALKTRP